MRALALAALLALASSARADDSLRCGEWLVERGASQAEVAGKCGAPTRADTRLERARTRWGWRSCTIDRWTYDRGPGDFVRTLEFHDGALTTVAVGDYGP